MNSDIIKSKNFCEQTKKHGITNKCTVQKNYDADQKLEQLHDQNNYSSIPTSSKYIFNIRNSYFFNN